VHHSPENRAVAPPYPLVSPLPQAISIVMPFTASPREVEALSAWDKAMIVLFACDPRVHDRALQLGYSSILHQGATAGVIQPGSDKPFVRDMIEAVLRKSPGAAWYGIANSDIRPCPHAFTSLCRANIYHRLSVDDWGDRYGVPYYNGEDMFVMNGDIACHLLAAAPQLIIGAAYWDSWVAAYLKVAHDAPRYYDRIFHKKHPIGHSVTSAEAAHNQAVIRSDKYWRYYWSNRARFSHEAHRDAAQIPLHYTAPVT
jgi:hypothetical protein